MPTPSDPAFLPFVAGDVISSANMYALFDDPASIGASLSVINGGLGETNVAVGLDIDYTFTQRGSHVDCEGSSGTAALDYIPVLAFPTWRSTVTTTSSISNKTPFKPVPGACRTFYMPWAGSALVTWNVFWTFNNGSHNDQRSSLFLVVDGVLDEASERWQGQTVYSGLIEGYQKARCFSGHTWLDLAAGWHDTGIYLLSDNRHHLTRVHSANIHLMKFKTGSAL